MVLGVGVDVCDIARKLGIRRWLLALSHGDSSAVASVIAEDSEARRSRGH